MQSFKNSLDYFREKESITLHKYVLQKMSSKIAIERREAIARRNANENGNGSGQGNVSEPIPCVSKHLYDTPVSQQIY